MQDKYIKFINSCAYIRLMNMAYIRSKKVKGNTYYYVVEGKLDKRGKVKQKVILYLGNIDNVIRVFSLYKSNLKN